MLNTFPALLTYSNFAPTILRIAVAVSFFYIAYAQAKRHKEISAYKLPLIGHADQTLVFISSIIIFLTGAALFVGWHTQLAALLGIIISLKHAVYAKQYPRAIPLCRLDYVYVILIMLTLLLTSAGQFGFDRFW